MIALTIGTGAWLAGGAGGGPEGWAVTVAVTWLALQLL